MIFMTNLRACTLKLQITAIITFVDILMNIFDGTHTSTDFHTDLIVEIKQKKSIIWNNELISCINIFSIDMFNYGPAIISSTIKLVAIHIFFCFLGERFRKIFFTFSVFYTYAKGGPTFYKFF